MISVRFRFSRDTGETALHQQFLVLPSVSYCFRRFPMISIGLLTRRLPEGKREMKVKLTPAFVSKAKPPEKGDRIVYWDEAMPGLRFDGDRGGP